MCVTEIGVPAVIVDIGAVWKPRRIRRLAALFLVLTGCTQCATAQPDNTRPPEHELEAAGLSFQWSTAIGPCTEFCCPIPFRPFDSPSESGTGMAHGSLVPFGSVSAGLDGGGLALGVGAFEREPGEAQSSIRAGIKLLNMWADEDDDSNQHLLFGPELAVTAPLGGGVGVAMSIGLLHDEDLGSWTGLFSIGLCL